MFLITLPFLTSAGEAVVADQIQAIYGGNFPITISLAGVNVFAQGLVALPFQTGTGPIAVIIRLFQFRRRHRTHGGFPVSPDL